MSISRKDVEHVALLSRLEISEKEAGVYAKQLSEILSYMEKINELETSNIEPTAHVLPLNNVFREDKVEQSLAREEALKNTPDTEQGHVKVPKIV